MPWQREFTLRSRSKGVHLVTREVEEAIAEGLRGTQVGLLHLFIKHTSASLALGENWDSEVRSDMDRAMDHIVPEQGAIPWDHIDEGTSSSFSPFFLLHVPPLPGDMSISQVDWLTGELTD